MCVCVCVCVCVVFVAYVNMRVCVCVFMLVNRALVPSFSNCANYIEILGIRAEDDAVYNVYVCISVMLVVEVTMQCLVAMAP